MRVINRNFVSLYIFSRRTNFFSSLLFETLQLCQSRIGVRIPNRQTFEIDHKLDILVIALVYIMIE
jgi:hypothetical protein